MFGAISGQLCSLMLGIDLVEASTWSRHRIGNGRKAKVSKSKVQA